MAGINNEKDFLLDVESTQGGGDDDYKKRLAELVADLESQETSLMDLEPNDGRLLRR